MTQPNENEALGTNEPCIEVIRNCEDEGCKIRVAPMPTTIVWVDSAGAGKVALTYHDGLLQEITVFNGKMVKKTHTSRDGESSHVILNFRGDF